VLGDMDKESTMQGNLKRQKEVQEQILQTARVKKKRRKFIRSISTYECRVERRIILDFPCIR